MLCIWRGELDRCHYALVRCVRVVEAPPRTGRLHSIQAAFVNGTGGVSCETYPPTYKTRSGIELHTMDLAEPTTTHTSVDDMVAYLKRRLLLVGGDSAAYEALGLDRPKQVDVGGITANPEKDKELADLYARAALIMKVPVGELRKRYSHLNRGLQAMNLRNRLRERGSNV